MQWVTRLLRRFATTVRGILSALILLLILMSPAVAPTTKIANSDQYCDVRTICPTS
jgi:di/tricarboxylate transporter